MEINREEIRQTVTRLNYSPLTAIIKAGFELEGVLEHLQKDEFTSDDIREISSSFSDVTEAVDRIRRVLEVKNR